MDNTESRARIGAIDRTVSGELYARAHAYLYEGATDNSLAILKAMVPRKPMTDQEKVEAILAFCEEYPPMLYDEAKARDD